MGATGCKSQANSSVTVCTMFCISQELLHVALCPAAITQTTHCSCNLLFSCPSCKSPTSPKQGRNHGAGTLLSVWSGKCYKIILSIFSLWGSSLCIGLYALANLKRSITLLKPTLPPEYSKVKHLPHTRGSQCEHKSPDPLKLNFPVCCKMLGVLMQWVKSTISAVKSVPPWTTQLSFPKVESELICNYWLQAVH